MSPHKLSVATAPSVFRGLVHKIHRGVSDVDNARRTQEPRHLLDRFHCRGQTDSLQRAAACLAHQSFEPCQGQGEVRAAFVSSYGVDLIDDHHLCVL
jgi:hypothetical protein